MKMANVLICGVARQGVLKAGEIVCAAASGAGFDVKMTVSRNTEYKDESVTCSLRFGLKIYSPLIRYGEGDAVIAFDKLEALRARPYAAKNALVVVDDFVSGLPGSDTGKYVANLREQFWPLTERVVVLPQETTAPIGALKTEFLLGVYSAYSPIPEEYWLDAIDSVSGGNGGGYTEAFAQGRAYAAERVGIMVNHVLPLEEERQTSGVRNFDEMLDVVKTLPMRKIAVAGAQNLAALHAGIECMEMGIGKPIFIGDEEKIRELARSNFPNFDIDSCEIVDAKDDGAIAGHSVTLVRQGRANILLKGGVNTPTLMRAVLHKRTGLRASSVLSDTFVFEYPDEDGKRLIMITDGGVTLQPTIQQKVEILKNAVLVAHALGNTRPRVALLAASETINPNVSATMDAAVITKMNQTGQLTGCVVEGPIALDVAVSRKAASIKGTDSEVAGRADILVTASIDTANALAKSTTYFAGYRLAHVIVGGTAPILIASRSDSSDAKLLSVALGSLMARHFEEQRMLGGERPA